MLGRRLGGSGREPATKQGLDPDCAASRGLRHRCSPSPSLVWPPSPPLLTRLPLPLSPLLGRAATSRRATVTPPAAGLATLKHAWALRARPQCSTGSQGGADKPPSATEERGGRSHAARLVSGRKGLTEWRRLLGNILPVPPSAHAACSAHAPRVDLVTVLTASRATLWRTIKEVLEGLTGPEGVCAARARLL